MKSLKQIRATLIEAVAQDTEARFVAPTEAQSSISADRGSNEQAHEYKCSNCDSTDVAMIGGEMLCNKCGQDAEKIDEEGGDREIGPGTQLRTNKGVWCVVDEIDTADSKYAWCTDEDGGEIHVNLNTADVIRSRPPLDRKDQHTSMYQEGMDPQKKRKNLEISMDYLHKKIRDEKDFYKKDEYKDELRKFRNMYDKLDDGEATPPTEAQSSISADRDSNEQAHEYKCSNCDSTDVAMIGGEMLCNKCGQDAVQIKEGALTDIQRYSTSELRGMRDHYGILVKNKKDKSGNPDLKRIRAAILKNVEAELGRREGVAEDSAGYSSDSEQIPVGPEKSGGSLDLEKDPVEKWIDDYSKSTDDRFKGKSKSERIKMAVSDFNKANAEKNEGAIAESMDGGHQAEEVSMTRLELDEIADMADDLFHVLPNFDEVPAWVQHKVAAMHAGLHSIYDYYRLKGIERDQCSKGGLEVITIATPQNPVVQPAPVKPAPMD